MSESLYAQKRDLAKRLILEELNAVERSGVANCFTAIRIAKAAAMHGEDDLIRRCMDWLSLVLRLTSDNHFKDCEASEFVVPTALDFRTYTDDEFQHYINSLADDSHIKACLNGDYMTAMSLAASEREREEVGLTFAMLGKLSLAQRTVDESDLPDFRRSAIINQIEIRKILDSDSQGYMHEQEVSGDHHFEWRIDAALLLLGFLPYLGYPFPDW